MRPYLRVANVHEDRLDLSDVMEMNFSPEEARKFELRPGDILLNEGQSKELVGRPAMYRGELPGACFTNALGRFRAGASVEPAFALHLFRHYLHSGAFQRIAQVTTNIAHLGAGRLAAMPFPLPAIQEQRRLVRWIEAARERSRLVKAAIETASSLVNRLRQSILDATFRGDLTSDWRAAHPDVEPAAEFLKRIRAERRHRWEEMELSRLADMQKTPSDDRWKAKYEEPEPVDDTDLPNLPDGWCWASMDELLVAIEAGNSFKCQERPPETGEVGVLKVSAVTGGEYAEEESKTCVTPDRVDEKLFVRIGDFLLSRANTLELVGTCAIARKVRRQVMLSDKILRLRLAIDETQWPLLMLRSPWGRSQIQAGSSGNQLSMRNIGQAAIRRIALPLPPSEEVGMLLERSASGLEVGDSLASLVESARRALPSLERATLNEAFSGKLR